MILKLKFIPILKIRESLENILKHSKSNLLAVNIVLQEVSKFSLFKEKGIGSLRSLPIFPNHGYT